jgi:peroxiredoxin
MSLTNALNDVKAQAKQALPAEISAAFGAEQARNTVSGAASAGAVLPDFKLTDAAGEPISLGEIVADGPAVLVFYRGGWCPYCSLTLRTYQQELLPQLENLGVPLVAISPQLPDGSLSTKEKNELEFTVLSDVGNDVARSLGITYRQEQDVRNGAKALGVDVAEVNGAEDVELPHPAVLIVDSDKVVRFIDVHPDYTTRTEASDIVSALRR